MDYEWLFRTVILFLQQNPPGRLRIQFWLEKYMLNRYSRVLKGSDFIFIVRIHLVHINIKITDY